MTYNPGNKNMFQGTIKYGLIYNGYAANDARHIANTGWHLPTLTELNTLVTYCGGSDVAGGKLKSIGTTYWDSPNTGATNEMWFNARGSDGIGTGSWMNLKQTFTSWSSTFDVDGYYCLGLIWNDDYAVTSVMGAILTTDGATIRLIKDSTTLSHGQKSTYIGNNGKIYETICIGTQEWLSGNLVETKYRNGDTITEVGTPASWPGLTSGALCAYNNDWTNVMY